MILKASSLVSVVGVEELTRIGAEPRHQHLPADSDLRRGGACSTSS